MGNQANGGKGKNPPNPNYGGGGTDLSNGVYNASASAQAAQPQYDAGLGAGTMGATGTTGTGTTDPNMAAAVGSTGATATQLPATQVQGGDQAQSLQGANPNGAAFTGAAPTKGQGGVGGKGTNTPAPGGTMQAATGVNQALGPSTQPFPTYSPSYVAPGPAGATGASSPMSGTSLQLGQPGAKGAGGKGGQAGAPGGTVGSLLDRLGIGGQSGGQTGVAGATGTTAPGATGATGAPIDYAAQSGRFNAQNDPTGAWAKFYNMQQQGKAEAAAAPAWMKAAMAGSDMNGGTLQQRAESEQKYGADTGATTKDWRSVVNKMSGGKDPMQALSDIYATAKKAGGQSEANIHRALMANGIDPSIANRLHEMFASGTDQQGAARRLGLEQEFLKFKGASQSQMTSAQELADWHKANPTAGATGSTTTGATGATGPLVGGRNATGTTGATGTVVTGATGPPTPSTDPMPGGAPDPSVQTIQQLAQKYMVSPDIARQIYRAILEQSMSSGGGNSNNSGSGDGDGGGDE